MNKKDILVFSTFGIATIAICVCVYIGCKSDNKDNSPVDGAKIIFVDKIIHDTIYVDVVNKDTLLEKEYNKLREQYIVDEYKLERIKYYNKIAAKGNNIKYLRGWINRVINE